MKKDFLSFIGILCLLFSTNSSAFVSQAKPNPITFKTGKLVNKNPLGVWSYTVAGVESKYEKGVLFIRKERDNYIVEVHLSNGTLTGQDVQVVEDTVKFNINIEGTKRVSVVLTVLGDTIKGKSYSDDGTYEIIGERKLAQG
jgi:hypothetical protein